jgi:putative transposase
MSAPISLRRDFDASQLRSLAKKMKDGPQARRLLALAAIYDGAARTEAAKIGGPTAAAMNASAEPIARIVV